MITKLPPVGFKILQISLQIMHHFLSRLCWPLLKVHFAGHAHVKLVLDVGMWVVTDWECGSLVTNYPRAPPIRVYFLTFESETGCLFSSRVPNLYDHSEPRCLFTVLFGTLLLVLTYLSFVQEINPSFDVFNIFKVLI